MLEAKYYRDYGHNYMILQCRQQETVRSYQYKILTSGKIGEILSCSVRHINGCTYYYYDISSRTTLDSLYRDKKMTYAQVKDVLYQIHGICQKLAGYFMEETGLVLLPEHIYYDISGKKYIGLYYPDYQPSGSIYRTLIDFLLEHIDADDRNLAERMYRICEMAEESSFFIDDVLQILEEDEERVQGLSPEPVCDQTNEPDIAVIQDCDTGELVFDEKGRGQSKQRRNVFYPIFAVLSGLGIAGAVAVCNLYELTQREELTIYGTAAATGVCFLLCMAGIISDSKRKTLSKKKYAADKEVDFRSEFGKVLYTESEENRTADHSAGVNTLPLNQVISRDMEIEMAGYDPVINQAVSDDGRMYRAAQPHKAYDNGGYGDTVFYDGNAANEYKLYAMDKKNKNHIDLKRFPCTIGKMAGCVDLVLSDDSISRIHARFDMEGEKVLLTDMNSTNGTYKNGLRMQPQETVEIEPGDEVRFGNLNYCYR